MPKFTSRRKRHRFAFTFGTLLFKTKSKPSIVRLEASELGPKIVNGNSSKILTGNESISLGGWKLVSLDSQIQLRTHAAQNVFKEFNPPTMDEETYLKLLEDQGFFAQYIS